MILIAVRIGYLACNKLLNVVKLLHGEAANRNEIHAQSDGGQLSGYLGLVFPHVHKSVVRYEYKTDQFSQFE